MTPPMKKQQGFTLVELIFVIVILGILAATALPRFINLSEDARQSALEGMTGSMRSAAAMAHAEALVKEQNGPTGSITVEGLTIGLVNGYPTGNSIMTMISDTSGFSITAGAGSAVVVNGAATPASCQVEYTNAATGLAPSIVLTTTDCS